MIHNINTNKIIFIVLIGSLGRKTFVLKSKQPSAIIELKMEERNKDAEGEMKNCLWPYLAHRFRTKNTTNSHCRTRRTLFRTDRPRETQFFRENLQFSSLAIETRRTRSEPAKNNDADKVLYTLAACIVYVELHFDLTISRPQWNKNDHTTPKRTTATNFVAAMVEVTRHLQNSGRKIQSILSEWVAQKQQQLAMCGCVSGSVLVWFLWLRNKNNACLPT